ncbi:MAG: hypothetical protein ACLFQU_00110 [Candidatus Kapaibacterium sp.]
MADELSKENNGFYENDGLENADFDRDKYIRSLESAYELLQREVEILRAQNNPVKNSGNADISYLKDVPGEFLSCLSEYELLEKLHKKLNEKYPVIESNIYFTDAAGRLHPVSDKPLSPTIDRTFAYLEEQGIIDWAAENGKSRIIPNISSEVSAPANFIIVPLFLRAELIGIFLATLSSTPAELSDSDLGHLAFLAEYAAMTIDNLRSLQERKKIRSQIEQFRKKMASSFKMASVGKFAASISREIQSPIDIIKANIDLIRSGVGDPDIRLDLIQKNLDKINTVNSRLAAISSEYYEMENESISIPDIIEGLLMITSAQFQRDGIRIDKTIEDGDFIIITNKSKFEQALLNLLLCSRDSMPDGGIICLRLKYSGSYALLSLKDDGMGITSGNRDIAGNDRIEETETLINELGFKLNIYNEEGKGTTYIMSVPMK